MSKMSYIILPKYEERQIAPAKLSRRVIANAMRLLIAVILMSALVAIIILAAHRAVDVQPVQPWTLAPALVPSTFEIPPPGILERKYILCMSELSNRSSDLKWGNLWKTENRIMQTALDLFKQCAVIKVQLDVGKEEWQQNVSTNSDPPRMLQCAGARDWDCDCQRSKPANQPKLLEYLEMTQQSVPVYSVDDEHLFHGTNFLLTWQGLYNNASKDDVLDRCIRLTLVWRYGGLACNLHEATEELLQNFKHPLDTRGESVVLARDLSVVYSRHSCHSAIGTMLVDYARFSLQLSYPVESFYDQEKAIQQNVEELFQDSVYFAPTSGYSTRQHASRLSEERDFWSFVPNS